MPDDNTADLMLRVAKLEDINEIQRLQADYAAACDDLYNPDRLCALFTADGVWDGGEQLGRFAGHDELHSFFGGAKDSFTWALHFMVAPSIVVADDRHTASGSWYLLEPATLRDESGSTDDYWLASTYDIAYRNTPDGWRIEVMKLEPKMWAKHRDGWGAS